MTTEPRYLTATDVASMLQVDESTVYRWSAGDSTMPATRVGGVVRFDRARLDEWLAARTQGNRKRTAGRCSREIEEAKRT